MRQITIKLLAAFLFVLGACTPGSHEKAALPAPLCVAVAYDVSGSVAQLELPVMTMEHVDKIISLVKKRGGCLAFGLIDEKAFAPLARLELLQVSGKLNERARINQKNQKGEAEFREILEKKISRPRNAKRTDINGSIARFGLFFSEPTFMADAETVIIYISDGVDTGTWRNLKGIKLPKDVKVYVVGMEENLARKFFGQQAVLFEGIDAAIETLGSVNVKSRS